MNVPPTALTLLGILTLSLAPLEAAYIQNISFGYDNGPAFSPEYGYFTLQYESGFNVLTGQNGSIDWMTMTVGSNTQELVHDRVVVANYFGFAFYPATGQVQIGVGPDFLVGFAPGLFINKINGAEWELRQSNSPNIATSTAYAPINYFHAGNAQYVPESGGTGAMMLGGLLCVGLAARKWRRKTRGSQP
jgi:hypothetical protein